MRSGEGDELIVGVDGLSLLVGSDGDGGEGRNEEARIEHGLDHGQHVGMHRDLLEGRPMFEEVVHPHGAHPFEEIVGRHRAQVVLELQERLVDFVHEVGLDGVGEDGETLLGDPCEVGFEVGQRADASGAV